MNRKTEKWKLLKHFEKPFYLFPCVSLSHTHTHSFLSFSLPSNSLSLCLSICLCKQFLDDFFLKCFHFKEARRRRRRPTAFNFPSMDTYTHFNVSIDSGQRSSAIRLANDEARLRRTMDRSIIKIFDRKRNSFSTWKDAFCKMI